MLLLPPSFRHDGAVDRAELTVNDDRLQLRIRKENAEQ